MLPIETLFTKFVTMITIYDTSGKTVMQTAIGSGSIRHCDLMSNDYIKLKFCAATPVVIDRGCYVIITGNSDAKTTDSVSAERYVATEPSFPTYNQSNGGYDF